NNVDTALNIVPELTEALIEPLGYPAATNSIWELESSKAILVVSGNPTEEQNVLAVPVKRASRAGASVIVVDARETELTRYAKHWLKPRPGTEALVLGAMLRVIFEESLEDKDFSANKAAGLAELKQHLWDFDIVRMSSRTGVPQDALRAAARAYGSARPAAVLFGADTTNRSERADLAQAAVNLMLATGNVGVRGGGVFPLYHGANTQGALDVGCVPDFLPGFRRIDSADARKAVAELWNANVPEVSGSGVGLMLEQMAQGQIKAAIVMSDGIAPKTDALGDFQGAVAKSEFLVVSDYIMSEMAQEADVLLPAATYSEVQGTYTNLERRVQLLRQGMTSTGEEKPGWQSLALIGRALGASGFEFQTPAAVFDEITRIAEPYKGLNYARIQERGIQWPIPAVDHPGTPILTGGEGRKPKFRAVVPRAASERAEGEFPFVLAHGRVLLDPGRDVEVYKVGSMNRVRREEWVEIHPEDARSLGVSEGDLVDVRSQPRVDGGSDVFTGRARLTGPNRGVVSITTLFAQLALDVHDSQHPDPAPRVRGLPLRRVALARSPVEAATAAGD
ncbi:MAG: molybdopterin-dependent oxidoreductase, partial [Chloroflexi bacterium]|nr:molybdopterin-dependent oxidoreductase [Chloroflexota bacterium]